MPRRLLWLPMIALVLSATGAPHVVSAGASQPSAPTGEARAARPRVLVLVLRATWPEVRPLLAADRGPVAAGLVTTLAGGASPAERVLSVAAGEPVDATGLWPAPTAAAIQRLHHDHPGALRTSPAVDVLAGPGADAVGCFSLLSGGRSVTARSLPGSGPFAPRPGRLLVVGLADARQLADLLPRLDGAGPVLVAGLEAGPGRARTAPLAELGAAPGLLTSGSTHRRGLAAWADIRPTVGAAGSGAGSPMVVDGATAPLDAVTRLDRQVLALVAARGPAQVLLPLLAGVAFLLVLAVLFLRREPLRGAARVAAVAVLALPAGFLLAGVVAPESAGLWLGLGVAAGGALWGLSLAAGAGRAPVVAAAALLVLMAVDLLSGSPGLSRPLLGGSAFDGERFYGMGNGYFADALAAVIVVVTCARLGRRGAVALVAALAVVDGLPWLGADVGGVVSCVAAAVAAWVLLGARRPSTRAVLAVVVVAALAAIVIVAGAGLGGPATHGTRFLHNVGGGRFADAASVVRHRFATNGRLLATNVWAWYGPIQVVVLAALLTRPVRWLPTLGRRTRNAMLTGVVGMAALVVGNDTGVTAAAGGGLTLLMLYCLACLAAAGPGRIPGDRTR